jgi:hypothetical protein
MVFEVQEGDKDVVRYRWCTHKHTCPCECCRTQSVRANTSIRHTVEEVQSTLRVG